MGQRIFANENWESFNQLKLVVTSNCKNIINPALPSVSQMMAK
ncbi:hypothetical protein QK908_08180 [Lactococcus cremoris]